MLCTLFTACLAGRYGHDCARVVLCGEGAQNDPVTGRCHCSPGRRGEDCGQGRFPLMNPVEQITMCGSVFTTQIGLFASLSVYKLKVCNICVCLNYVCNMCVFVMGNVCVLAGCPPGWFGEDCALLCNCSNGGLCDSVSGSCTCGLGWTGAHCDTGERYCTVHLYKIIGNSYECNNSTLSAGFHSGDDIL